jgi:Domain of unknown function (DUF3846)
MNPVPKEGKFIYIIKPKDLVIPPGELIKTKLKLETLQAGVEGYIEVIPYFNRFYERNCIAFCNEEGKLHNLSANRLAHTLWERAVGRNIYEDHLVGNIVIIVGPSSYLRTL